MTPVELPEPRSVWLATAPSTARRAGTVPREADVVVLGGGIAGLTTAYLLAEAGRSVLLLEADEIAAGVSGNTTAKVTAQHSLIYHDLATHRGPATAASYGASQLAALEWIARTVADHGIDCQFERADSHVYSTDPGRCDQFRAEAEAATVAGLPAEYLDELDLPVGAACAVRFRDQAQFHPRQWLLALAGLIEARGGRIVEGVRATGVTEGAPAIVRTSAGAVRANAVVVATHYPIFDRGMYFARLEPTRDLVVSGPATRTVTGMYLDGDTHYSVRNVLVDGERHLIVGGEHYRVGDHVNVEERYQRLAAWARDHLGLREVSHRWSAHDLSTLDRIPYVGRYHPASKNLWVATGFGQWGMTGGTSAGLLLRDLVQGERNELASVFDPNRVSLRSVGKFTANNATVAKFLAGDHVRALRGGAADGLAPGEATVTREGATMVAAYRDEGGELHKVSARCTHLGCLVAFNNAERSWDCPCHGSRFDVDGEVLHGPAVRPLRRITEEEEK